MRILITGGDTPLGRTLSEELGNRDIFTADSTTLAVTDERSVARAFQERQPEIVLHCAMLTDPEICESDPARAWAVNVHGSSNIAAACRTTGAKLIAFSTGRVFDGARELPYSEFDRPTGGISVCGQSAWSGECAMRLNCSEHLIVRTAWLYGPGGPSYVHTLMRMAQEGTSEVRAASDQKGCPTSTYAVAAVIRKLLRSPRLMGTLHLSCGGEASRYDFARAVFELAGLGQKVVPCLSGEIPGSAVEPRSLKLENRMLGMFGLPPMPDWRTALADFMRREFSPAAGGSVR